MGNKFLSHIREVDAIVEVVRTFEDADIIHVHEKVDPIFDIEIINKLVKEEKIPPLEFSLRLVFTMELYGFTAFAEKMGGNLWGKVSSAYPKG